MMRAAALTAGAVGRLAVAVFRGTRAGSVRFTSWSTTGHIVMSARRAAITLATVTRRTSASTRPTTLRQPCRRTISWNTNQAKPISVLGASQQHRTFSSASFVARVDLPVIRITDASLDSTEGMLNTSWDDGSEAQFPLLWLRENCQCTECFHPPSLQRLFLLRNLRLDGVITELKVADGGVRLTWDDGHVSEFTPAWLRNRRFGADAAAAMKPWRPIQVKLWGREDKQNQVTTDTMHNLLTDDGALFRWLCTLEQDGVFLITDAAHQEGELNKLAHTVAYLRKTNYGETFTVKAKLSASNVAYTSATLGFHTDLAYFRYAPGMQMLHCIKQVACEGGDNQLVDAFYIAEMMRRQHPHHFHILSTLPIQFVDVGTDYYPYHQLFTVPVFSLDENGELERIAYTNHARDSTMLNVSAEDVNKFYHALKCFEDLMNREENHIHFKMREGDIICFHNYRVLHARTGFVAQEEGVRHLQGGYIDWDELRSRRRVLQKQLDNSS